MAERPGDIRISINNEEGRFELYVDGAFAGRIEFRRQPGVIAAIHTIVEPGYEGRGLASRLTAGALAIIRSEGVALLPCCPYVNGYLKRHPEDVDLVPADRRAEFDLA